MNWISLRYPASSDITGVVLTVVVRGHPRVATRDITILRLDEIRVRDTMTGTPGFPIKDLKMELVVARHNRHHHTTHYTPIHWSKLEVRDLSNIHNVWYPTTALTFTFVQENIPHKLIARKLRQIPALREYAANIKPNRMRDLGLIQYHKRKQLEKPHGIQ